VTTNDDSVWALNATTGAVKWRWSPSDQAVFSDFGVVTNRGVALCDGHVFELTLDMNIVSLDPATGALQKEVPISDAVPGATVGYGYSETSAPICADHTVIFGAAGSEYGVRGFVMAYHTNLTPAWPNPFWTVPPEGTEWRSFDRLAGGGVVWTPGTVDPTTGTLYVGTASATPFYFPSVRPGSDPRSDSLIAIDIATGRLRWWQQQLSFNEWKYDTSQPPLVYTATIGGKTQRVVSVATMEGLWFAYNAKTGAPIYQQVKVLDHTEHPNLVPGKPVVIYPSSIRGPQLLARILRSADGRRPQRGGGDRGDRGPSDSDAGSEEGQVHARRRLPRALERQLRPVAAGLARLRLDQRDQPQHRDDRLEVRYAAA